MESICLFVVFIASLIGIIQGGPVGETTNPHIQSIHLRLEVLNQVAANMESDLAKYGKACEIAKSIKRVIAEIHHETSFLIAGQQIQDICKWLASHTYTADIPVNCSTVESSIDTAEDLCSEISLTNNISSEIQKAISVTDSMQTDEDTAQQSAQFAMEFSQDLPQSVQAIVCAPFGC